MEAVAPKAVSKTKPEQANQDSGVYIKADYPNGTLFTKVDIPKENKLAVKLAKELEKKSDAYDKLEAKKKVNDFGFFTLAVLSLLPFGITAFDYLKKHL